MSQLLDGLTDPQREAVTHIDGPMLVVAGAGSGKTRVVTRRIAHLIEQGIPDYNILALTFTNKAAGEMAARVEGLVGPIRSLVSTFHSACARWLRFDIEKFPCGRDNRFSIYDSDDQKGVIKSCLKELNLDPKQHAPGAISNFISRCKTDMLSVDEAISDAYGAKAEAQAKVYQLYEQKLRNANSLDFDDLLWLTLQMLASSPAILETYRRRYRYILVDEYQDTNRVQYLLLKALAGQVRNIHATGDPDQSIYSWRGANYRNIMDFQEDYPGTKIVVLEQNYRSKGRILKVSNDLIAHNTDRYDKSLFTDREDGETVKVVHLPDDRSEAAFVVSEVKSLFSSGVKPSDIALFYRVNAQSRSLEEVLMREGVPYTIIGGVRYYDRKEIRDFLSYLKVINNPRDAAAFSRMVITPPKGVGSKTIDKLQAAADSNMQGMAEFLAADDFDTHWPGKMTAKLKALRDLVRTISALPRKPVRPLVEEILKVSGLKDYFKDSNDPRAEERVENIEALVNRAAEFDQLHPEGDLAQFLEEVALVSDVDEWQSGDRITLMTIHAAKGLEFPAVFVVGVDEGLIPHKNSSEDPKAEEEERRLLYVAMTRAEERLYLTTAAQRMHWGSIDISRPSAFLDEIPPEHVDEIGEGDTSMIMPSSLMPKMGRAGNNPFGAYQGSRAPFGQGKRRKFGMGQPRRRTFDDLDFDFMDDLPDVEAEDISQESPDEDFFF